MKRNRKLKKHSRCAGNSVNIVALIVLSFFALMVYWSQDARCSALSQEIGRAEREYKRLESNCQREASNWEDLKTLANLDQALIRHGIDMRQANQEQIVHMGANGQPEPGQISVARIRSRRSRMDRIADVRPAARAAASGRARAVTPARPAQKAGVRRR